MNIKVPDCQGILVLNAAQFQKQST